MGESSKSIAIYLDFIMRVDIKGKSSEGKTSMYYHQIMQYTVIPLIFPSIKEEMFEINKNKFFSKQKIITRKLTNPLEKYIKNKLF